MMAERSPGTVFLIGAGPGDPGLLTVKGMRCLEAADVVIVPSMAFGEAGGWVPGRYPRTVHWLRRMYEQGATVCSACTGANLTAEAGLLDGNEATVSFHNTPLTDLTVSVDSQVNGGTASTISCKDAADASVASGSTGTDGDGSVTASDLEPGTYTCTVVVDP